MLTARDLYCKQCFHVSVNNFHLVNSTKKHVKLKQIKYLLIRYRGHRILVMLNNNINRNKAVHVTDLRFFICNPRAFKTSSS
jgi:hypothetical protein